MTCSGCSPAREVDAKALQEMVALADERTIDQDPSYAIRLMVDIAIRALSPAINDPTTAVQALDRIGDLLRHVVHRRLDVLSTAGAEGPGRLIIRTATWNDYVELAFSEIRDYGRTSTQVLRKMRAVLQGLLETAPPQRRGSIEDQLRQLDTCVEGSFPDAASQRLASVADTQGLGGTGGAA